MPVGAVASKFPFAEMRSASIVRFYYERPFALAGYFELTTARPSSCISRSADHNYPLSLMYAGELCREGMTCYREEVFVSERFQRHSAGKETNLKAT